MLILVVARHQIVDELLGFAQSILHVIDTIDELLDRAQQVKIRFGNFARTVLRDAIVIAAVRILLQHTERRHVTDSLRDVHVRRWNVLLYRLHHSTFTKHRRTVNYIKTETEHYSRRAELGNVSLAYLVAHSSSSADQ